MEVGCLLARSLAPSLAPSLLLLLQPRRTYGHAESVPIVAIQFVGSLL